MQQYQICGRKTPDEKNPNPEVYRMTIFARNDVVAESRFWYYLADSKKIKRSQGQIVGSKIISEDDTNIKTFGIVLHYRNRTGRHNMYREIRESTISRAMEKIYSVMASLYHVKYQDVQVVKFEVIKNEDAKRPAVVQVLPNAESHTHQQTVHFPYNFKAAAIKRRAKLAVVTKGPIVLE